MSEGRKDQRLTVLALPAWAKRQLLLNKAQTGVSLCDQVVEALQRTWGPAVGAPPTARPIRAGSYEGPAVVPNPAGDIIQSGPYAGMRVQKVERVPWNL